MEEIKLWKISRRNSAAQAISVESADQTETEKLLEDVLSASPELLMSGLQAIGRQINTPSGPLDLLGVDETGRLVVFELKRGVLTRDAVAQVIDYASCLSSFATAELCACISPSMKTIDGEKIDDFETWYDSNFPRTLREIAKPKVVLVGLGSDERAKRMVEFLSGTGLDISMVTFQAFRDAGETFLARQVEVTSRTDASVAKSGKAANLAKLTATLNAMGIKSEYEKLFGELRAGMGDSTYPYPYSPGYSFTLPGPTPSGGQTALARVALYVTEKKPSKIRVSVQPRTMAAVGQETVRAAAAKELGTELIVTPAGYGDFSINAQNPKAPEVMRRLGSAIGNEWRKEREKDEAKTVEAAEKDAFASSDQ